MAQVRAGLVATIRRVAARHADVLPAGGHTCAIDADVTGRAFEATVSTIVRIVLQVDALFIAAIKARAALAGEGFPAPRVDRTAEPGRARAHWRAAMLVVAPLAIGAAVARAAERTGGIAAWRRLVVWRRGVLASSLTAGPDVARIGIATRGDVAPAALNGTAGPIATKVPGGTLVVAGAGRADVLLANRCGVGAVTAVTAVAGGTRGITADTGRSSGSTLRQIGLRQVLAGVGCAAAVVARHSGAGGALYGHAAARIHSATLVDARFGFGQG